MRFLTLPSLVGLALAIVSSGLVESHIRSVRILYSDGAVEIRNPNRVDGQQAPLVDLPLMEGDVIDTRSPGRVEMQLECTSVVRVLPSSHVVMSKLALEDDGKRITQITVVAGTLIATLRSNDGAGFFLLFPGGSVRAAEPRASMRVDVPRTPGVTATVRALSGSVLVDFESARYTLKKSQQVMLVPSKQAEITPADPADPWTRWSLDRDHAFERQFVRIPLPDSNSTPPEFAPLSHQAMEILRVQSSAGCTRKFKDGS